MVSFEDKKILLGVTGGIAAYKSADLCRQLVKSGAQVRVVLTRGATEFVAPLTFQALSGNPVHTALLDPDAEAGMGHIELAKWPDLIVVAPATANFISLYSQGQASDLLTTLLLASEAPVAIVPAMNQAMWRHPMTQRNLDSLKGLLADKLLQWGPAEGEQACGDVGPGRMLEASQVAEHALHFFESRRVALQSSGSLSGKRVVITAGPTREAIDPVRYISNHSSGKMGYALAEAFEQCGASVVLVSGPVAIPVPKGVQGVSVESAEQMHSAVDQIVGERCDIFVAAAAVADYRPVDVAVSKMKKVDDGELTLTLRQNPDIVASVASRKVRPFVVGFAAETNDVLAYARAKREKKNLDMIIANDVSNSKIGFNSDNNAVHVITAAGETELPEQSKVVLARQIVELIAKELAAKNENA